MNKVIDKGFRSCRFVSTIVKHPVCSCAVYPGLLFRWCESTAAIARVSEAYLVSHCTMERRQAVYLQIESETGGREGVVHPGIVIAPAVDVVLLGSMFFVEDR